MKVFFRLLSYSARYRWRFTGGIIVAFFVAVLNGLSLTTLYPMFDALGEKQSVFEIQLTGAERNLLRKAAWYNLRYPLFAPPPARPWVPYAPEAIDAARAAELLPLIDDSLAFNIDRAEQLQLRYVIRAKLEINRLKLSPREAVWISCAILAPLYGLKLLLLLVSVRLMAGAGYMAVRDLRDDLYSRMQRLPLTYFYSEKSGELTSRMINDVENLAAVISSNMRDAITNLFIILTHVALLAWLNLNLFLLTILAVPVIMSPITLFARKIKNSVDRSQSLLAGLNGHLQESISGVRVIRSAAAEDYESARFRKVNDRFYWRSFKQVFYLKLGPYLVEFNSVIVALAFLALGALYVDGVNFTTGQFIAFLAVLLSIIRPIIQISSMYSKINAATAAGDRVFGLMDRKPESTDPQNPRPLKRLKRSIQFDNVSFAYPGSLREVLHNVSITAPIGSTVALVGESGAGKSTLMDLLARFFDPTEGRILVDGQDIRDFRVSDHRSRIGIVTQEIFLFYGTIFQNIAYGSPYHDRREVEKAARLAYAHDFIKEFYEGYNTLVGNRGVTLSGGQRQRIAIARALLHDPEILILDEATSALDTESERLVQQALERLFMNRTTFVIAHRLSTIEKADQIVVLSEGRVADAGAHKELLERGGLYARLQEISRSIGAPPAPAGPPR